jgi:peptide/nickel transport system substrate-binding protein/oligopeptide transport system substrate-binding protein
MGAMLCSCKRRSDGINAGSRDQQSSMLNIASTDEPKRLDPAFVKDLYEGIVSGLIYDGLVEFGSGSDVKPGLADRWTLSPDGRTYTFHLRKATFHNGAPVTSADVRYSLTRVLWPQTNSDRKWVLDRIEGAKAVADGTTKTLSGLETPDIHTVKITLSEPYPVFLTMLAMPTAVIIPKDSAGRDKPDAAFNQNPIGSGPWVMVKWLHDQRLQFVRNERYWAGAPRLKKLLFYIQSDESVQRKQFEVGNLDIYQVGFAVYSNWMHDPAKRELTTSVQELRTDYIGFMNNKPSLSDVRVRRAISLAINRQMIFSNLQKERGVLAHGPVPPGIQGYDDSIKPLPFDPAAARKLITEAGATQLQLDFWYRDEALNSEIVTQVIKDLAEIGVKVTPMPRDQATLRAAIWNGTPDLFLGSWTLDYPYIENALTPPFHSRNIPTQGNGSHFSDSQLDKILDQAEHETNASFRIEKYREAERRVIEECPWVFLFHRKTYYAVRPEVTGYSPALMYNADRYLHVDKHSK